MAVRPKWFGGTVTTFVRQPGHAVSIETGLEYQSGAGAVGVESQGQPASPRLMMDHHHRFRRSHCRDVAEQRDGHAGCSRPAHRQGHRHRGPDDQPGALEVEQIPVEKLLIRNRGRVRYVDLRRHGQVGHHATTVMSIERGLPVSRAPARPSFRCGVIGAVGTGRIAGCLCRHQGPLEHITQKL